MRTGCLSLNRKGAVSVMFAAASVPMLGVVGLAVDYGIWNQSNATLLVAANVAAMTAVKVAANAQLAGDPNALTEGQTAGQQWFLAEVNGGGKIGTEGVTLAGAGATVQITGGATVTAQVSYTGTVPSVFGNLFGKASYGIFGTAAAQVTSAPYLNIEMLLDNSSSMDIGATPSDMAHLQQISACDTSNAVYNGNKGDSHDGYWNYSYSNSGRIYDGPLNKATLGEVVLLGGTAGPIYMDQRNNNGNLGPSCNGFAGSIIKGVTPTAGPPCEFACHWDKSANSGLAQDLYGAARRTIGTLNPITLRFDLVKNATNLVLKNMQDDDLSIKNLKVGIFTFNTKLTQVYPGSGEAADDWSAAMAAVGTPPSTATQAETGIIPVVGKREDEGNNDDTDVVDAMNTLQTNYLTTPSGDGTTTATPRKVLFLITDGFMDDSARGRSAFPTSLCDGFKNLNYTIYVVYTPYYPIEHIAYLQNNWSAIVNGSGPGTLQNGLQACASAPGDYISAADGPSLNAALAKFLKSALSSPARFTM